MPTFSPGTVGHADGELAEVHGAAPVGVHLQEEVQDLPRVVEELGLARLALRQLLNHVLDVGQTDVAVVGRVEA